MRAWVTGVLAFVVCIAFISPWPDGALAPRICVLSLAVPVLLCCVGSIRPSIGLYLIAGLVLYSGLSLVWTPAVLEGLYILWGFILFLGIFCLPGVPRAAYLGAALALIPNAAVTVLQVFDVQLVNTLTMQSGLFFNKSPSAEITAMVAVGLAAGAWWLIPFMIAPLVVQPWSRGPMIAAAVVTFVTIWQKYRFIGLLVGILVAGLVVRLVLNPAHTTNNFERIALWADMIRGLTVFGHGLGSFPWAYPYFEHAHNDLLQIAYELGVPGVLLFGGFLGYCLWAGALTERLVLLTFVVEGFFGFPLYNPAACALAALVAGELCRARGHVRSLRDLGQSAVHAGQTVGLPDGSREAVSPLR